MAQWLAHSSIGAGLGISRTHLECQVDMLAARSLPHKVETWISRASRARSQTRRTTELWV